MAATSLIQAKIDPEIKQKAERCLSAFGIDSATAIRIYFAKIAETGKIPFVVGFEDDDFWQEYSTAITGTQLSENMHQKIDKWKWTKK
ncbi:hypothetical protein FACS1894178_6000 [Bacteroidia bacterium]|nr:hypothetical protein FACS1894178_6000 [Bacteroidia bacterium]